MVLWFLNMFQSFPRATSEAISAKVIALLLVIFMFLVQEYNILKSGTLFLYLFSIYLFSFSNFLSSAAIYICLSFSGKLKMLRNADINPYPANVENMASSYQC